MTLSVVDLGKMDLDDDGSQVRLVRSNDLVERPRAGAHDRAVYRSRPLQ